MNLVKEAAKGGIWLTIFRIISQIFSWISTVIIARILSPEDYGLMEMATVFTGYVSLFSELGLGAAIIQRKQITEEEISSLFWFLIIWGFILGFISFLLSYPTALIFHEEKVLRVTQAVAILYIIGSFIIVPVNLMTRELKFKIIGLIDALSIILCCIAMIIIAKLGGGVWTLIGGHIIRQFLRCIFYFSFSKWRPRFHFDLKEVKPYIKFGLHVAGARTLFYVYTKADRFFGGKVLGSESLGYYCLALQLASIPADKIVALINTISFPLFSKYQENRGIFNSFYLKLNKFVSFIMFPVYLGGIFIADELIPVILGKKWIPIIFPFKILCISKLITAITAHNSICNTAQGRPHLNFYYNFVNFVFLPLSFFIASKYGLNGLVIPWITVFPGLRLGFIWITIRKLNISVKDYINSFKKPVFAVFFLIILLTSVKNLYLFLISKNLNSWKYLIFIVFSGTLCYLIFIFLFQRSFIKLIFELRK